MPGGGMKSEKFAPLPPAGNPAWSHHFQNCTLVRSYDSYRIREHFDVALHSQFSSSNQSCPVSQRCFPSRNIPNIIFCQMAGAKPCGGISPSIGGSLADSSGWSTALQSFTQDPQSKLAKKTCKNTFWFHLMVSPLVSQCQRDPGGTKPILWLTGKKLRRKCSDLIAAFTGFPWHHQNAQTFRNFSISKTSVSESYTTNSQTLSTHLSKRLWKFAISATRPHLGRHRLRWISQTRCCSPEPSRQSPLHPSASAMHHSRQPPAWHSPHCPQKAQLTIVAQSLPADSASCISDCCDMRKPVGNRYQSSVVPSGKSRRMTTFLLDLSTGRTFGSSRKTGIKISKFCSLTSN